MREFSPDSEAFWGYMLRNGYGGFFGMEEADGEVSSSQATVSEPESYSGRITTRIAPHVHAQAAKLATAQGISLNQYINDAIIAMNYQLLGIQRTVPVVVQAMDDYEKKLGSRSVRSDGAMTITVPKSTGSLRVYPKKGKVDKS